MSQLRSQAMSDKSTSENSPLLTKSENSPLTKSSLDKEQTTEEFVGKTYKIRWLVLLVFFSHILYTNLAWSNVDSIANVAECYYNVDVFWINSLSYLFYVTYVLCFVFATWFLGRFGLRWAAIVSGCLGAAGAWIRFAGTGPQYFWLLLPGQVLASIPNIIEWSAPALLSAVWFPPNERAIATTLVSAISPQSGILISLVLGPLIIKNSKTNTVCDPSFTRHSFAFDEWQEDIYNKMFYYLLGQAIFATLLVPISFMIPSEPPTPPSVSRHVEDGMEKMMVLQSMIALSKNCNYIIFLIIFGILLGVAAVCVTVYEEVLNHSGYHERNTDIAYLGFSIQIAAIAVLVVMGKWIDFTKTFYCSSVVVCFASTIIATGLAVAILFHTHFFVIFVLCTLTISVLAAFQAIAYEFGVEMTFPVPESVSISLLNAVSQIIATVMTLVASAMIKADATYVFFFLAACLGFASLLQIFIKPKLRRVELDSSNTSPKNGCCKLFSRPLKTSIQIED